MLSTVRSNPACNVPGSPDFAVAVVQADPGGAAKLVRWLQRSGHRCRSFATPAALSQALRRDTFDLLILDCDVADANFAVLTGQLRQRAGFEIPILALGSGAGERDILAAVDRGADAYLPTPLSAPELAARSRALLLRCYPMAHRAVREIGAYRFDMRSRSALVDGAPVDLRGHEFDFAACLFAHLGRTLSHRYLTEIALGAGGQMDNQTFRTVISRLRRKLQLQGDAAFHLRAMHTQGYRLTHTGAENAPVSAAPAPSAAATARSAARPPT